MAIIVFQHHEVCRPGRLGLTFRDHGLKLDVRRLDRGDGIPVDFDDVDGVISLGGPQNVDEPHKWIEKECEFLREAHERALPVIGSCLGAQLIAKALGGEVGPMDVPEVGFLPVEISPVGQTDPILSGIAWRSPQFQKHGYEVKTLPEGARLLASSERCKVQIFTSGLRTYAFQSHFEADKAIIDAMLEMASSDLSRSGFDRKSLAQQFDAHYEMFARLSNRLCLNLVTYLVPRVAALVD